MKKIYVLLMCAAIGLAAAGCGKVTETPDQGTQEVSVADQGEAEQSVQAEEYPQIAYVNNILYYATGEECTMVPKMAPEGTIETFYPAEIMPDAPNSANFGEEYKTMEYMTLEDGTLIIHMGEQWMYFEEAVAE